MTWASSFLDISQGKRGQPCPLLVAINRVPIAMLSRV